MHWIDWTIVAAVLASIVAVAMYTNRYTKSVADFLAANRCAGRYLLCISEGIAGLCAISIVAMFEIYYEAGFTAAWWELMMSPVTLILALSGWIIYRFRQTRALTLAQFFEVRYSKRFRVFAGIVLWVSGIVNFGIFPSVGARFFIYFCGLPETVPYLGLSTYAGVMLVLLAISLFFVFLGGQIAVMITDFLQGMFVNVAFLIILVAILWALDWSTIIETLKTAPENASRIHPFHTAQVDGFNVWYYIIQIVTYVYGWRAWQGSQAYNCSAKSAHEARMAGMLGQFKAVLMALVMMLPAIGAYVVLHNPEYAGIQAEVQQHLDTIASPTIQKQMTVPLALAHSLPVGIIGMLCAVMLAAFISTHDTYLHSWGSIFVQDVILPFRKRPFTPRQHIWLLRISITFVAVFIFIWSLTFNQAEYIRMFFAITGAIWLGGAGAVIVGGLYWRRGSTAGAFAAVITGAVIALGGIILQQIWQPWLYPFMEQHAPFLIDGVRYVLEGISSHVWGINWTVTPDKFPIDGQWVNLIAMVCAAAAYVIFSLVSWRWFKHPPFEMDRLLHQGKYAIKGDSAPGIETAEAKRPRFLPGPEFTFTDKCIYYGNMAWTLGWLAIFVAVTAYNIGHDVSEDTWATFWRYNVMITVGVYACVTVWFFFGGLHDIRDLFKTLATMKRDDRDDGMVVDGHYLVDEPEEPAGEAGE